MDGAERDRIAREMAELQREVAPEFAADIDTTIRGFVGENIAALPMRSPADVRAAGELLERRRALVEQGRRAVDERMGRVSVQAYTIVGQHDPDRVVENLVESLREKFAPWFALMDIEDRQITEYEELVAFLLDPELVAWRDGAGGRYLSADAEKRRNEIDQKIGSLESSKAEPYRKIMAAVRAAAPAGR